MSISFCPYVYEPVRGRWLSPPAAHHDPDSFEINVSNNNGADLLLAMGLDHDGDYSQMPIDAFAALVTAALRRHLGRRSPALETIADHKPGLITIIHCSRREGYIEERLRALAALVQRSRAVEATHFGWG